MLRIDIIFPTQQRGDGNMQRFGKVEQFKIWNNPFPRSGSKTP